MHDNMFIRVFAQIKCAILTERGGVCACRLHYSIAVSLASVRI